MSRPRRIAKFPLGVVVATPAAEAALKRAGDKAMPFLLRHMSGDWGDLCREDKEENERALREGLRVHSSYALSDGTKIWLITEADRSVTTVLLPSDY